jgi:phosphoribosylglycinamide formyltransferase-1
VRLVNLLVDLADARFDRSSVHHELEALDRRGVYPLREHRTPEGILGWIDGEFDGTWSSEAALGGMWIAQSAERPVAFVAYDVRGLRYHWLRSWARQPSVGLLGPLGVELSARRRGIGSSLTRAALFSLRERGYRQALIAAVDPASAVAFYERHAGARAVETFDPLRSPRRWRATVLASGNGSNFQAVVDAVARYELPLDVAALVTNRRDAYALERAARAGIATHVLAWRRDAESRETYDARLLDVVAATEPHVVLLLGWMHVLPATFLARFPETLNVHPAFLPLDPSADVVTMPDGTTIAAFRGARAFDDALVAGSRWSGASVHRVNVAVDRGAILARAPLALEAQTRDEAEARLHALEHRVLQTALTRWCWERP